MIMRGIIQISIHIHIHMDTGWEVIAEDMGVELMAATEEVTVAMEAMVVILRLSVSPFSNTISSLINQSHFIARFMISFNDPYKFWWDVMVLCMAIFICYLLPVYLAFEPPFGHSTWWHAVEYFIEVVFAIDVLVHFNTSLYDEDGN